MFQSVFHFTLCSIDTFGDRAQTAIAYSFNPDFQGVIRRLMESANDPRNKTYRSTDNKISAINDEIENTKSTVMESIEKVLDRGEKIELLVHKSDQLDDQARKFNRHSKKLKNRMMWKNIKMTLLLIMVLLVVVWLISSMICGFNYSKCS